MPSFAFRPLVAVLVLCLGAAMASAQETASVVVSPVTRTDIAQVVTVTGTLVAREEAQVPARIAGQEVREILVEAGDTVKAGDALARLERTTLAAQLEQAQANLAAATAGIAQADAQVRSAEASARQAALALDRTKQLASRGDAAQASLDQVQATADQADAATGAAQAQRTSAQAAEAQAKAALDIAEANLGYTVVTAPVGGLILERNARLGTLTGAGEPLFRIAEDGAVELEADVVETDLAMLAMSDPGTVAVAGLPPHTGHVRLISPQIDPVTRLGRVRVALDDAATSGAHVPRPGAFARAEVTVDRRSALTVPTSAVLSQDGIDRVQRVRDGMVETVEVATGIVANGRREIRSGLTEGDTVVVRSGAFLRDGDKVNPVAGDAAGDPPPEEAERPAEEVSDASVRGIGPIGAANAQEASR